MPLSTGVMVLYADDESFTLVTPQGHMFAGWITFSAYEEDGYTVAQAQFLLRANDPLYEIGFRFGAFKVEDIFWQKTLQAVAAHFSADVPVQALIVCGPEDTMVVCQKYMVQRSDLDDVPCHNCSCALGSEEGAAQKCVEVGIVMIHLAGHMVSGGLMNGTPTPAH